MFTKKFGSPSSGSLRARSPIWASEASLARSRETRLTRPNRRACSQANRRGAFEMFSRRKRYAIAANKRLRGRLADSIIGHLPREISRATRFFLLRGGMVHLKVTHENYRRSPLIQGGLEIPVEVICEMDDTPRNRAVMERIQDTRNYTLQGAGTGWSI